MAKIHSSDQAPAEVVTYAFSGEPFKLGGNKKTHETTDADTINGALTHPWLTVEYDKADIEQGTYVEQLAPEDDHLSAAGGIDVNDPEEARKAEESKAEAFINSVALDAGLDQTKPVETDNVAETLAADDTSKTAQKGKE